MKWLVIYTKPKQEIRISNHLNSIGIKAYCPTYTTLVKYTDRKEGHKTFNTFLCSSLYI